MGTDYNKSVGRRLYEARKAKGYSRAKVGELVGLHETTVTVSYTHLTLPTTERV